MTIGDLFDPIYVIYAPKTFILKFCIGLIIKLIAHKLGKISTSNNSGHVFALPFLQQLVVCCSM